MEKEKIDAVKKDFEEHFASFNADEEEAHANYDSYWESYFSAERKRDDAKKRGDTKGVAKAEDEMGFWLDSIGDAKYEIALVDQEWDACEEAAKYHGFVLDEEGNLVRDDRPRLYDEDIEGTVADLFSSDSTDKADDHYNDDVDVDKLVADLIGDSKEVDNND